MKNNVFTIPSGISFVDCLAKGLLDLYKYDSIALSNTTIFLPSKRGIRNLRDAFLRMSGGQMMLLPSLRALGDGLEEEPELILSSDELAQDMLEMKPPVSSSARLFLLTKLLLEEYTAKTGDDISYSDAFALASELASIIDSLTSEKIPLEKLKTLDVGSYSEHWQKSLNVLQIAVEIFPEKLADYGYVDTGIYRNRTLDLLTQYWSKNPPTRPIIVAGSTGSMPATAEFIAMVATLPNGMVILPGVDTSMDKTSLDMIQADHSDYWCHPQFGLQRLIPKLGVELKDVQMWDAAKYFDSDISALRRSLFGEVMRLSETTEEWKNFSTKMSLDDYKKSTQGLKLIEAKNDREEAAAIAIIMREVLETKGKTAALITPNRVLAARVKAALKRWNIDIDDSGGTQLCDLPAGLFLRQLLCVIEDNFSPISLLSLLKHPYAACGLSKGDFRKNVSKLEKTLLRGRKPPKGLQGLFIALKQKKEDLAKRKKDIADFSEVENFLNILQTHFMPLMQLPAKQCSLKTYLETFVLVAESLCNSQEGDIIVQGTNILWANEDGDCAYKMLIEFQNSSEMIGDMDTDSIQKHLERYMTRIAVRPTFGSHPRLFIWGTPEARLQQCDVLILGGLNEESFPIMPDCCIWLSRAMRDKIGLSRPERRIGLAAHDFVQAACAKNVFLTRSLRANGKPQIAARWLFRLESLITGAFGKEAYEDLKNTPYLHYVKLLDMPENSKSYIATPPMPTPPTQMRPRKLPITEIGTWVRDPYAIYAKHILGLKKLDPIDASVEARDKGTKIHYLLEVFLKEFKDTLPISAKTRLNELTLQLREEMRQDPLLYSIWGGRLNIIKDYYFQWEQKHRKAGNKPYLIEQEASLNFDIKMDNGEIRQFTLTGKADRIDKDPFGNAIIIDYKTGNPPTYKEVAAGFEPQLPLEAILLKEGGFGGDYKIDTNQLIYIHLKGTQKEQGKIIYIEPSKKDNYENLRDLIQGTRDNFINWIKKFEDSKQPYFSRIRVKNENIHYDYDHLARVLEWGGGSNDE